MAIPFNVPHEDDGDILEDLMLLANIQLAMCKQLKVLHELQRSTLDYIEADQATGQISHGTSSSNTLTQNFNEDLTESSQVSGVDDLPGIGPVSSHTFQIENSEVDDERFYQLGCVLRQISDNFVDREKKPEPKPSSTGGMFSILSHLVQPSFTWTAVIAIVGGWWYTRSR